MCTCSSAVSYCLLQVDCCYISYNRLFFDFYPHASCMLTSHSAQKAELSLKKYENPSLCWKPCKLFPSHSEKRQSALLVSRRWLSWPCYSLVTLSTLPCSPCFSYRSFLAVLLTYARQSLKQRDFSYLFPCPGNYFQVLPILFDDA